jgi:hypothetical protein
MILTFSNIKKGPSISREKCFQTLRGIYNIYDFTVVPDLFVIFARFFQFKNVILKNNSLSKLKSLCFDDSKPF